MKNHLSISEGIVIIPAISSAILSVKYKIFDYFSSRRRLIQFCFLIILIFCFFLTVIYLYFNFKCGMWV